MGQSKNAVATTATKEVALKTQAELDEWGVPKLSAKDIMIPKILVMQAMSKMVVNSIAKFGEFVESLNKTALGDCAKPVELLPFFRTMDWVVQREKNGKFEFNRIVPITLGNDDEEFEQIDPDTKAKEKWYRTANFYCLRPTEIEGGSDIPYVVSFRSTSSKAGSKIATTMYVKNLNQGLTPASTVMEISGEKTTNDKGTFIVMDARDKRRATDAEVARAKYWLGIVRSGAAKVDHSDLEADNDESEVDVTKTATSGKF